jgi:predicted nucleic acid-binding protein
MRRTIDSRPGIRDAGAPARAFSGLIRTAAGALSVLLLGAGALGGMPDGPGVSATATVDTTDYRIGDRIEIEVRLEHPPGTEVEPAAVDSGGVFTLLEREGIERISDGESMARFTVAAYDTGRLTIPPFRFRAVAPGDTAAVEVTTGPIEVVLHDVPVDTTADIRDIRPPVSLGYSWREAVVPGLLLLAALVVAGLVVRAVRRRRRGRDVVPEPGPVDARPPHEIALERLRRIEAERIWQAGEVKRYHSEVTDVVRSYLEARFRIAAPELTTEEILAEVRRDGLDSRAAAEIERVLRRADRVKFARYRPLPEENEAAMREAFAVVERTAEAVGGADGGSDDALG